MRRIPVVAAFLVVVSGICLQVAGNGSEVPGSFAPSRLGNISLEKNTHRLTPAAPEYGLRDFPILQSQTTLPRLPTKPHRVTLSWQPSISTVGTNPTPISGYNVYRRSALSTEYIRINGELVPITSYVDLAVRSGSVYDYETTAVNSGGVESPPSNQIRVRIPYP